MDGLQSGAALWAILEAESVFIPEDLKLILKATKYDNLFLLENFNEKDKEKIEIFMQTLLFQIIKEENREQYYGIFKDHPEKFVLVGGLEQTLNAIIELAKKVGTASRQPKDPAFVSTTSRKTQEKCNVKQETDDEKILTLKTILENNVNKYLLENYLGQPLSQVSARVSADGLGSYIATLQCPVGDCKKLTKITRNKTRWNTSNFYSHVNIHCSHKKPPRNTVNLVQMCSQTTEQTSKNQASKKTSKGEVLKRKRLKNSDSSSGEEELEFVDVGSSLENEEENCRIGRCHEVRIDALQETNPQSSKADWNFPNVE